MWLLHLQVGQPNGEMVAGPVGYVRLTGWQVVKDIKVYDHCDTVKKSQSDEHVPERGERNRREGEFARQKRPAEEAPSPLPYNLA